MVNAASTEPPFEATEEQQALDRLLPALDRATPAALPTSGVYAFAALDAGFPYVNMTPSRGATLPALEQLARERNVPHAGQDLKTGETLLKSVLAPLFAKRNLRVHSWVGHNILGNRDGQVLNDPDNKASKVTSKDKLLAELLGYRPQSHVSIEFIESLDDWKTAWDHIHFEGFLGTKMMLQFTWQGCDSLLAAPLVIDLVRLAALAQRHDVSGVHIVSHGFDGGVLLGAGAKVLGNIEVGEYSRVGSGSVVLKPVPPRTTVAGVPARVIGKAGSARPSQEMDQCLPDGDGSN